MSIEFDKWVKDWLRYGRCRSIEITILKHGHKTFNERKKIRTQK